MVEEEKNESITFKEKSTPPKAVWFGAENVQEIRLITSIPRTTGGRLSQGIWKRDKAKLASGTSERRKNAESNKKRAR